MNPLALFTGPYAMLARAGIVVLILAASFAAGWVKGNQHGTEKLTEYQAAQATEALKVVIKQGKTTERVVNHYIKVKGETQIKTVTIQKEVIRYVNAKLDNFDLSNGAVSLLDAAAANVLPDSARSTDGTPSGIKVAQAVPVVTANYATCNETANRLRGMQAWAREQAEVRP